MVYKNKYLPMSMAESIRLKNQPPKQHPTPWPQHFHGDLRITGVCHSSGQSVQIPTDPAQQKMDVVVQIGLMPGICSGLGWDVP